MHTRLFFILNGVEWSIADKERCYAGFGFGEN